MALVLESSNRVWERVRIALAAASPASQLAFKQLKLWLATQKGNPQLQFLPFTAAGIVGATGQILVAGACSIYGIYGKKAATAVAVYLAFMDSATTSAGVPGTGRFTFAELASGTESLFLSPAGIAFANGVIGKAYTDWDGVVDSAVADAPLGFVIVGS